MKRWYFLCAAIASEVVATLSLRASIDNPIWSAIVVVGYIMAFSLLGLTLRAGMPIGVAYGVWGAAGVALVALFGVLLFNEALSWAAIGGIILIIGGVALVQTGSKLEAVSEARP